MYGDKVKFVVKDTVFRNLFSIKRYQLQLYKTLHPEDTDIKESDLQLVTLESILLNSSYNDLGILVRNDKLIILVEAQTTWSVNIVIRSLMYLMSTYQNFFRKNKTDLYSGKKIQMPKPELYMIYTGKQGNNPDIISLKDEFFPNEYCCINAEVKVIYFKESKDIINQYIGFCRIISEQTHKYGRTRTAITETLRICRDEDLLKEYLDERELEVEDIMLTLFSQEEVYENALYNAAIEAREEGISQGISQGSFITLADLVRSGDISIEIAAKKSGLSVAEFQNKMRQ